MKNRPYKIVLSRGDNIPIDEDEIDKIMDNLGGKNLIKLRRGVFNPSFFISLVPDYERLRDYRKDAKWTRNAPKYPPKLKDVFENTVKKLNVNYGQLRDKN